MIEAYFLLSTGAVVPALVPEGEILEIAAIAGLSNDELFSIEIPAGASRHTRIRVLVSQNQITTLYANNAGGGVGTAQFKWREASSLAVHSIDVWLLPPRPLYIVPTHAGVSVVEAVDVRYWWKRTVLATTVDNPVLGPMFSSDGRWQASGLGATTPLLTLLTTLKGLLPFGTFGNGTYNPALLLNNRLADHRLTPDCSIAMAIDIVLSATGYILLWDYASGYICCEIKNDIALLDAYMNANHRAYTAGLEPTSSTVVATDLLLLSWNASGNTQINRMPNEVATSFPYRDIEGRTRYCNNSAALSSAFLKFTDWCEFGVEDPLATGRVRQPNGTTMLLREPRPLVAAEDIVWDPSVDLTNTLNTPLPPAWDWVGYKTLVIALLQKRCEMSIGKVVWMGWPTVAFGAFRGTMLRYSIGQRTKQLSHSRELGSNVGDENQLVPITTTECDPEDWIFGPDGLPADHPSEIVMGKGLAQARRLGSGITMIDVAPPNTRVFPAIIGASTRIGTTMIIDGLASDYWRWTYAFQEVEPNTSANSPLTVDIGGRKRTGTARNMMENGNVFTVAGAGSNVIAGGVVQADVTTATIDCLPICEASVVLMVEHFPTAFVTTPLASRTAQYWFSTPNAVKVTCTEVIPP